MSVSICETYWCALHSLQKPTSLKQLVHLLSYITPNETIRLWMVLCKVVKKILFGEHFQIWFLCIKRLQLLVILSSLSTFKLKHWVQTFNVSKTLFYLYSSLRIHLSILYSPNYYLVIAVVSGATFGLLSS